MLSNLASFSISQCSRLRFLRLAIPHHISAFSTLAGLLQGIKDIKCQELEIYTNIYPNCPKPTITEWEVLDNVLQQPPWDTVQFINLGQHCREAKDQTTLTWGDFYPYTQWNLAVAQEWCQELKTYLPLTTTGNRLWYNYTGYSNWKRVV